MSKYFDMYCVFPWTQIEKASISVYLGSYERSRRVIMMLFIFVLVVSLVILNCFFVKLLNLKDSALFLYPLLPTTTFSINHL